jgi:hypothetical protein
MSATSASQSTEISCAFLSSPERRLEKVTWRLILFSIRFSCTFPRPIFSLLVLPLDHSQYSHDPLASIDGCKQRRQRLEVRKRLVVEFKRFSYGRSREIQPYTRDGGAGEELEEGRGDRSARRRSAGAGSGGFKPGRARTKTDRGKRMGLEKPAWVPCKPLSTYHWRRTRIRARGPLGGSRRMTSYGRNRFVSLSRSPPAHTRTHHDHTKNPSFFPACCQCYHHFLPN